MNKPTEFARTTRDPADGIPDVLAPVEARVKVISRPGWFAARPSGTEDIYKLYAESFRGQEHLASMVEQAQQIISAAVA